MTARLPDDCFAAPDARLRHDEALAILRARVRPVVGVEHASLRAAVGRIAAADIRAPVTVPRFANAAVDGYAFAHADIEPTGGFMPVAARIAAGQSSGTALPSFSAARIFTGAAMPEGADTVAMQEDCRVETGDGRHFVQVPTGLRQGANRRRAGEDLAAGDRIAATGQTLRPQEVAALASVGIETAAVFGRPRVALLSTGDEIVRPGAAAGEGVVFDANHFLLAALLAGLGIVPTDLGIVADRPAVLETVLRDAAASHDLILTTGGASQGEEDHLSALLVRLGRRHLWQIAVKPGRPLGFGRIGDAAVLSLPGNPVAAFVCFLLYARPLILALGGATWSEPIAFPLPAAFAMTKRPGRREYLRGRLATVDGALAADRFPRDGSGIITSLRQSDGLILLPEELERLDAGDRVDFLPYAAFGI